MRRRPQTLRRSDQDLRTRDPLVVSPGGPGRPQHAAPVAARREGPTPDHTDSGGELPGDHGTAVDSKSPEGLPDTVDYC